MAGESPEAPPLAIRRERVVNRRSAAPSAPLRLAPASIRRPALRRDVHPEHSRSALAAKSGRTARLARRLQANDCWRRQTSGPEEGGFLCQGEKSVRSRPPAKSSGWRRSEEHT